MIARMIVSKTIIDETRLIFFTMLSINVKLLIGHVNLP